MPYRIPRWVLVLGLGLIALIIAGLVAFRFAATTLKDQVRVALGPESEVGAIGLTWTGVEILDLRIRAPKGWPAQDALRAERIVITPDLRGLITAEYRLRRVLVEKPYLSLLQSREGRMRLLPSLTERPPRKEAAKDAAPGPVVTIGTIQLEDAVVEFYDAKVRLPPLKLRLEDTRASLSDLTLPVPRGRSDIRLDGVLKGVQRNGTVSLAGWVELGSKDASLTTRLRGVDLVALQPYLIKASETGVRKGALDLDLQSTVRRNHLQAPGSITLSGLELAPGGGVLGTFLGVPREAAVRFLKNHDDRISLKFVLTGNVDDPHFSLNENLSVRIAVAMAEALGVASLDVLGEAGTLGQKGIEAAGEALGKLFGQ